MPISKTGLWYEFRGPPDGKVVILSPGMGGSASYWEPNLPALTEQYRVLLYDHRGTGRSDRVLDGEVSVRTMADDVRQLIEELGIRWPCFIGHALGGLIGLELELLDSLLDRLVIVNGWAELDPHFERCFEVRLELLQNSGPAAYVRAQPLFLYPANWISANIAQLDKEAEHQLANFPLVENLKRRIAAAKAFHLQQDLICDVLVIGAADDMLVPMRASENLAKQLPLSTFAEMKWGGHACNVTDPATFNHLVLDFLGS